MLVPSQYGLPLRALSSYYWTGQNGNSLKFPVGIGIAAIVEAGFLSGLTTGSGTGNLTQRAVAIYSTASNALRFSGASFAATANFVGTIGFRRMVFPLFAGWRVHGSPANAT